ncbi:MerR family transcriptional regulator [Halobacteriovorax sp. GB3]|uniref:MerR family transcriptional regulator n=1 Tax=Halobacteriovorax sp. GB3 TaxID=2719615 RepID=UPI00236293A2|nr:MerR family transcriptional regulator [Halobacteriovorax sp. GB3]MDD0854320.1 MerR family transcriptional regulator [Halobacteriovorax sp. GB3]
MKIGEVEKRTGISQRMIRHFESLNLFKASRIGKYRSYSEQDCLLIKRIRTLQDQGLSLKEIKSVIENPEEEFEQKLLNALARNKKLVRELNQKNEQLVKTLQSLSLNSSIESLLKEGLIMEFVKSFEEKNVVRGRMPYLEVFYETFTHLSGTEGNEFPMKILHSTDLMHIHEGLSTKYHNDLKVVVSSEEQQFRNAFVFFLSPELLKTITNEDFNIKNLESKKEVNLKITEWVNKTMSTFNHSWNAIFTKIELQNNGMLKENSDLSKLYHDDEIFILTNMYTEGEKERFSVGLPYRFVSIVYNLLKK